MMGKFVTQGWEEGVYFWTGMEKYNESAEKKENKKVVASAQRKQGDDQGSWKEAFAGREVSDKGVPVNWSHGYILNDSFCL